MQVRVLTLVAATVCLASADTLTLRNGQVVEGSYLGGNARQIRMAVGDSVRTFDVMEVSSIRFDGPAPAAAAPAPARTETAAAPAERRVLRPDPAAAPARTASPATAPVANEIPTGTQITIRMIDDVDSERARAGQTFRASVDEPVMVGDRVIVPRGADVVTKLVEVKDSGRLAGGGHLTLDIASIVVNGRPVDVATESVTAAGESRTGESARVIGGTAALGAVIGAIAGGGRGAAIGAASGAGAGTAIQVLTDGPRVRVPSETRLTFTLQHPVRY